MAKKPAAWTPPRGNFDEGNIAAFVQKHYGKNATIANNVYNRLRKKGAAFIRNSDGSFSRARPEEIAQAPQGWGSQGVVNLRNGFDAQGLDSSVWQTGQNAAGKWFARKPTLEQQLTPYERSTLAQFDATAAAGPGTLSKAYDNYATSAAQSAAQMKTQAQAQADAMKTNVAQGAPVEGVANPNAGTDAATLASLRATTATNPEVNYYQQMPAMVEAQRTAALAQQAAQERQQRSALMGQLTQNVEARKKYEKELKAQIRAAELAYLGDKAGAESALEKAKLDNQTDIAQSTIAAGAAVDAATIRAGATAGAAAGRAGAADAKAFKKWRDELKKRMGGRTRDYTVWALNGDTLWDDDEDPGTPKVPVTQKTPGATQVTKTDTIKGSQSPWASLVVEGISEGYNPKAVLQAVMRANPSVKRLGNRKVWSALVAAFVAEGEPLAKARTRATQMTGYKMKG